MEKQKTGVGRRKEAVTRVFVTKGDGKITVNDKDYKNYFISYILRMIFYTVSFMNYLFIFSKLSHISRNRSAFLCLRMHSLIAILYMDVIRDAVRPLEFSAI